VYISNAQNFPQQSLMMNFLMSIFLTCYNYILNLLTFADIGKSVILWGNIADASKLDESFLLSQYGETIESNMYVIVGIAIYCVLVYIGLIVYIFYMVKAVIDHRDTINSITDVCKNMQMDIEVMRIIQQKNTIEIKQMRDELASSVKLSAYKERIYTRETYHLDQTIEELNAKLTALDAKVNGISMGKRSFIPSRVQPIKEDDDEVKFIKIVKTKDEDKEEEEESVESTPENTIASQESSTSSSDTRKSGRDITKRKVMNISSTGNQSY
jgi:hypothetical protein